MTLSLGICCYREHQSEKQSHFGRNSQTYHALVTYSALMNALGSLISRWLLGPGELGVWRSSQGSWFVHHFGMLMSVYKIKQLRSSAYLKPCSTIPSKSLWPTQNGSSWLIKLKIQVQESLVASRVKSSSSWKTLDIFHQESSSSEPSLWQNGCNWI